MVIEDLKNGKVNKKAMLAENYKKLGLNENQYAIISLVLELDKLNIKISTPSQLAEYMTISQQQIEQEIASLIDKKLLIFDISSNNQNLDFSPLYSKLELIFQVNLIKGLENIDFVGFINSYFNETMNNAQIITLKEYVSKNNGTLKMLQILIDKKFKTLQEFIIYIEKRKDLELEDDVESLEFDWLRN